MSSRRDLDEIPVCTIALEYQSLQLTLKKRVLKRDVKKITAQIPDARNLKHSITGTAKNSETRILHGSDDQT